MELGDPWVEGGVTFSEDVHLIRKEIGEVYRDVFQGIYDWIKTDSEKRTKANAVMRAANVFIGQDNLDRLRRNPSGGERSTIQIIMMAANHGSKLAMNLEELRGLDRRLNGIRERDNFPDVRSVMIDHVAIHRDVSRDDRALMVDTVFASAISEYSAILADLISKIQYIHARVMAIHTKWMDRLYDEAHRLRFDVSTRLSQASAIPWESDFSEEEISHDDGPENVLNEWLRG
jgi:hypothetical protein